MFELTQFLGTLEKEVSSICNAWFAAFHSTATAERFFQDSESGERTAYAFAIMIDIATASTDAVRDRATRMISLLTKTSKHLSKHGEDEDVELVQSMIARLRLLPSYLDMAYAFSRAEKHSTAEDDDDDAVEVVSKKAKQ